MSKKIEALTMPKWGIEMEEGKLTEWLIEEGTSFSKGDPLLVVETDNQMKLKLNLMAYVEKN